MYFEFNICFQKNMQRIINFMPLLSDQINQNKSSENNIFIIPSYKILAQAANTRRNLVILNVSRVNNIHASQFASGRAHKNAKK